MSETTLYERLGEREGIRGVVDDFYERLLADEELAPFFEGAHVETLHRTQIDFLSEAAVGSYTYDAAPVPEAHLTVPFTSQDSQRAVEYSPDNPAAAGVSGEDAEAVIQAVAAYEDDRLATPDEPDVVRGE